MAKKDSDPKPEESLYPIIESGLSKINPKVFQGVNTSKKKEILEAFTESVGIMLSIEKSHSGPLPDPETLKEYGEIIPNGAERIMKMAESQSTHRIELEKLAITSQLSQSGRGQIFGFILGLSAVGGSITCILLGHEVGGSILGAGGITSLVSVFVLGRRSQSRNLDKKKP